MELGIYRIAEINKGGGLRQKAQGTAGQYLNGLGEWTTFPTALTPTAHNHSATEINTGNLALAQLPRIAAGSIYVGAGTSNDILTLAKGSSLQALRTNASGTALEWYTTQWQYGQYGTGSIKTNSATATGLRSGDESKPYVYWSALDGQDLKAGGLAGTDQKWMLISPSTIATYAYGGVEYTYNNATANYVFLLLIDNADFIGSATNPFNRCRIIANAGTNYLFSYRTILTVGTPITGNVYPVIVSTGSSTAPSGIAYTDPVSLYAPLKSSSTNYTGNYSVASGVNSVASGQYSIASGQSSVASGYSSVASGESSVASGYLSVAYGYHSVASGTISVASGYFSVASGYYSVASGAYSVASGANSVASGFSSVASGAYSVASGYSSVASGYSSVASGQSSVASGYYSVASGLYSVASGEAQTVIGKYNVANTTSAFIIGNGTSASARSNCMTVDFSGNMTLAGTLTLSTLAGADRIAYFDSAGTLQSSASYTLSSFASSSHNHDSTYLKLSGGTLTGKITLDTNGGIYKSGWDGNRIAYFVSGDLTTSSDYTLSSFALATHNHDGVYSPTSHTHSGYALATHNHDSAYSAIGHDHSGTYAAASHKHDSDYLKLSGGTMTGSISIPLDKSIIQNQRSSMNYTVGMLWLKGGVPTTHLVEGVDTPYTYESHIGRLNAYGDATHEGAICILPYATDSYPWGKGVGLYLEYNVARLDGKNILTEANFSVYAAPLSHTHSTYLPLDGGALTGDLSIGASSDLTLAKHAGANRLAYFDAAGVVQSDASILTTSFAAASHNHDSTYLKLSGGTVTGKITLDTNGGIFKSGWEGNRIAYFVSGDLTTSADYTLSSFALADHNHDSEYAAASHTHSGYAASAHNHDSAYSAIGHNHSGVYALADHNHDSEYAAASHSHSGYAASTHTHSIPDLYCGVPDIVPGRILISGSGASSYPTWLDAGTNGKILGWISGAPAWVDAPSGSSVSAANPTASVGLAAVNGSAATFMRSDAAPKLDVSIAPTWTGAHTFNGLTRFTNIGVGVAPSAAYKLYVVEDKEITTAGSYIGNYLIAKYNTALTSGTRQGIALLGQLWATGGTLTNAKGLDFKVYVPSGHVAEATAINAVIQTDGGSIGTAYCLKLSRSGTAPTVANYGIYQDDSTATNVFNGPCQFNGGTNLETGRVRNFLNLSASTTLTPAAGTDLLVVFETSGATTQTLTFPATNMAGRVGDIIRVVLCGNCKLTFSTGSGNLLIKPAYYGATANYYLTTQSTTGDWTFICDGTYWRAQMLSQLYE